MNKIKVIIAVVVVAVVGFIASRFIPMKNSEQGGQVPPPSSNSSNGNNSVSKNPASGSVPPPPVTSTSTPVAPVKTPSSTGDAGSPPPPVNPTAPVKSVYKDGAYTARGSYTSPEGLERVVVNVTLKNDVIVDTSMVGEATDGTSKMYQAKFINNYKPLVVGKNIADVKLGKVSGSSLTGTGFNNAIEKIKTEAQG